MRNDDQSYRLPQMPAAFSAGVRRAACILCLVLPTAASALDDGALQIGVTGSERYDSNLFDLADGVTPPGTTRRSAQSQSVGLTLNVTKSYGLQTFAIDASLARLHYVPYDNLDLTTHTVGASWRWTLTPELTGRFEFDQVKVPNYFGDTGFQSSANPRKTENRVFSVDYRPGAAIHPRFSFLSIEDRSATAVLNRDNSRTTSVEGALVYEFRSTNDVELYFRRGRGRYTDIGNDPALLLDDTYDESETGIGAHWNRDWSTLGKTTFDGQIGYLKREHQRFAQRNFSGPVGKISFVYYATGRTRVEINGVSTLSSAQSTFSSYSHDTSVSVSPIYALTGKINVGLAYSWAHRSFLGAVTNNQDTLRYTTRDATAFIGWNIWRSLDLTLSGFRESRVASSGAFQYVDVGGIANLALKF